jgi:MFS family permease
MYSLFRDIQGIPLYAWIAIILHIFEGFMSYPLDINMMSFFHQKFSMDDVTAGKYVSINGIFLVAFVLPGGWLVDKIGSRYALIIGFIVGGISRVFIAISDDKQEIMWALNVGVSIGSALIGLSLHIILDCMPESSSKNIAFALLYSSNNLGDAVASFANARMIAFGGVNEFQWVFLITAIVSIAGGILAFIWLWPPVQPIVISFEELEQPLSIWKSVKETVLDRTLHRALLMAFVLLGVRTMFRNLSNILPLYEQRLYGPTADYGFTLGLNPLGIIALSPLMGILLRNIKSVISLIFVGTLLSALSPLPMIVWRPEGNEWPVRIFITIFTIAESIYSPKVTQLAISMPPPGKKGIYSSFMTLPSFVGTLVSGMEAGLLLKYYCPEPVKVGYDQWNHRSCSNLWLVVMGVALTTPMAILISGNYFTKHLDNPQPILTADSSETEMLDGDIELEESKL